MNIRIINIIAGALAVFAPLVHAEIDISGYATFKVITNKNEDGASYYNGLALANQTNYDSRESNIGLQFSTDISSKMDMTVVMSARGGPNQQYNFETEWAYANYKVNNDVSLRMGKVKGPFYMVSDYKDVGYAYPWASVPEEVYSTNPIRSVNGLDLVYQKTINDISYLGEIYYGSGTSTAFVLPAGLAANPAAFPTGTTTSSKLSFRTHNMLGFNASVAFDGILFRVGYFKTLVDFGPLTNLEGEFGGVGFTIDKNNIVVYGEYIVRDTDPNLALAFPDVKAGYLTAGYRMGDYLPYVTVATIGEGKDVSATAPSQTSTTIGLRYELDDTASLKFEAASKEAEAVAGGGKFGLFDSPLTSTANVYTVAIDVLF